MAIDTIVVALAFDEGSQRIADRAVQLANSHDARLIGVHVIEKPPFLENGRRHFLHDDMLATMIGEASSERLQALLAGARKPAVTNVETGKPHAVIEALASAHGADLVIIGPGAAKNLREKTFGSTADRVVRSSPCPVLVVRAAAPAPYGRIAVGVDFSDHAKAAAAFASRLAPSASREFIHAVDIPPTFEQAMLKAGTPRKEIERYRRAEARTARWRVLDLFGEDGHLPPETGMTIVRGDAAAALIRASRRDATDLVALGTQGMNAVAQHLLGSVARKLLARAKCDVLVVPATAV